MKIKYIILSVGWLFIPGLALAQSVNVTTMGVGVGTGAPASALTVKGLSTTFVANEPLFDVKNFDNRVLGILGPAIDDQDAPFQFYTANAYQFLVDTTVVLHMGNNKRVGIGTSSPSSRLVVRDTRTDFVTKSPLFELRTFDGRTLGFMGPIEDSTNSPFVIQTGNAMDFQVDGDSALLINSSGRVGLGTVNIGTYKLAVNGQVKAKGFVTDTTNWADYIFTSDYKLPALAEVEAHIKTKGHLPGIPSEKEVKANGVDLGDMQVRLLAQIEQLNLHLIAQEKRLQAQEVRIRELEAK